MHEVVAYHTPGKRGEANKLEMCTKAGRATRNPRIPLQQQESSRNEEILESEKQGRDEDETRRTRGESGLSHEKDEIRNLAASSVS